MQAFNVYLNRKCIDTVFYSSLNGTRKEREDSVKHSLINHDGYDPNIRVILQGRITKDEYELQGLYSHGWECLCTEDTLKETKERRKEYQENEGGCYRIAKRRVRI